MSTLEKKYLKKRSPSALWCESVWVRSANWLRKLAGWLPRCCHPQEARSVLVIRHNQLGDAVAASGFIQALREMLPHATIDVAAGPANAEVFRWIPGVNEVHVVPTQGWARLRYYWSLRQRYDLVFQTLFDENYWKRLLAARIAASHGVLIARARGTPLEKLAEHAVYLPSGSYVGKLMALLQPIVPVDVETLIQKHPTHVLQLPARACEAAWAKIESARLPVGRLVALNLSARESFRALSVHQTAALARALCDMGQQPLLWCAPADSGLAQQVLALEPRAVYLRWDSLAESMAALQAVRLYVGPDTGTAHFAAAAGRPCVVLFAQQARPDVWLPYGVPCIAVQAGWNQTVPELPVGLLVQHIQRLLQGEHCIEIVTAQPLRYFSSPTG